MLLLPCPGAGSCCSRTDHSCERSACAVAEHAGVKFVTGKRDRLFPGTSLFVQLSAVLAEELHAPFVQPQQPSVGYGAATEIAGQVGQYATPLGIGFQDLHVPYLAAQLVEQASEARFTHAGRHAEFAPPTDAQTNGLNRAFPANVLPQPAGLPQTACGSAVVALMWYAWSLPGVTRIDVPVYRPWFEWYVLVVAGPVPRQVVRQLLSPDYS